MSNAERNERRETRVWSSLKSRIKAIIGTRSVRSRKGKGIDGRQESGKLLEIGGPSAWPAQGNASRGWSQRPEADAAQYGTGAHLRQLWAVATEFIPLLAAHAVAGDHLAPGVRVRAVRDRREHRVPVVRARRVEVRCTAHTAQHTLATRELNWTNQRIHLQIHSHRIRIQLTVQSHTRAVRRQRAARRH